MFPSSLVYYIFDLSPRCWAFFWHSLWRIACRFGCMADSADFTRWALCRDLAVFWLNPLSTPRSGVWYSCCEDEETRQNLGDGPNLAASGWAPACPLGPELLWCLWCDCDCLVRWGLLCRKSQKYSARDLWSRMVTILNNSILCISTLLTE